MSVTPSAVAWAPWNHANTTRRPPRQARERAVHARPRRHGLGAEARRDGAVGQVGVEARERRAAQRARQAGEGAPEHAAPLAREDARLGIRGRRGRVNVGRERAAPVLRAPAVNREVAADALEPRARPRDVAALERRDGQLLGEIIGGVARAPRVTARDRARLGPPDPLRLAVHSRHLRP
jgi:hypothetical protein